MVYLRHAPMPTADWTALEQGASDLRSKAQTANGCLIDATAAWSRLASAYQHPETQGQVLNALAELTGPGADWASSLGTAASALEDFVADGRPAAEELLKLETSGSSYRFKYPQLFDGSEVAETDLPAAARIEALDANIATAIARWEGIVASAVSSLGSIAIGTGEGLPAYGQWMLSPELPLVSWKGLTAAADANFGPRNPDVIARSVSGLSDSQLLDWAQSNPELAQILTNNRLDGTYPSGSPEQLMSAAIGDGAPSTPVRMLDIRDAWLALAPEDRSRMMLAFPGVLASLNGIPFADRVRGNKVAVAGEYQNVSDRIKALEASEPPTMGFWDSLNGGQGYAQATVRYADEMNQGLTDLKGQLTGLDWAMTHDSNLVVIGTEGDGSIVSMNGVFTDQTQKTFTMVPGTGADMAGFGGQATRLTALQGNMDAKVSFYWQGSDLPNMVPDNVNTEYSNRGGKGLALFDMAVDLETPEGARSTYLGYSAGASMLGAAEKEGLNSTNILYVAPAGPGPGVHSVGDTQNADANRYWIETRDDPIHMSQEWAAFLHGGSPEQMNAIRLEAGFMNPRDAGSLLSGHEDYFTPGSTAAQNIQGVIDGTEVSPFIRDWEFPVMPGKTAAVSPIEAMPETYTGDKMPKVTTDSLEW